MWVTEEVSLVEFHKSGLRLARDSGYELLLCLVAREADAPDAYKDLIRHWESIDDLTGPKILFLVAGRSVRKAHESDNIFRKSSESVLFSPNVLMLRSKSLPSNRSTNQTLSVVPHFELPVLQRHTQDRHSLFRTSSQARLSALATRQSDRPTLETIAASQTSQIRQLRDYLSLREEDLPCLHITFLDGSPPIHYRLAGQESFYATLKTIVETVESTERRIAKEELARLTRRQHELNVEKSSMNRELFKSPYYALQHVIASLQRSAPLGGVQNESITELISALQSHMEDPNDGSRRVAFSRLKSARATLADRGNWNEIRSGVQRLIDVALHSQQVDGLHAPNIGSVSPREIESALAHIEKEYSQLETLKGEQKRKLSSMLVLSGISTRLRTALSSEQGASMESFIVVAARQELLAIRQYLDAQGAQRQVYQLSEHRSAERIVLNLGVPLEFSLVLSAGQGLADMGELLTFIQNHANPKTILLVGMMAGIPGKSKLLDVQVPRNIVDGTRLGTRNGAIVAEPHGRDVDPVLHDRLQALDQASYGIEDISLVTHKHSVCVAAKLDDLSPELARAALATDPENIIGIEMEGSALTAKQAGQRLHGQATGYLMIKGVADYAGETPAAAEVTALRSVFSSSQEAETESLLSDPDPTANKPLKSALQRMATIRALRVALALLVAGERAKSRR